MPLMGLHLDRIHGPLHLISSRFRFTSFAVINQSSLKLYAESCKSSQQTTESRGDHGGPQTQGIISASLFVSSYYIILSDNKSYALITENLQSI